MNAKVLKSEWVVAVGEIGNLRARRFWENRLQESQRPSLEATPSVWVAFLKQKYIQHLWIPARSKVKTEDSKKQSDVMEDLLDIDFSGFGPDAVRMDESWNAETTGVARRPMPPHVARAVDTDKAFVNLVNPQRVPGSSSLVPVAPVAPVAPFAPAPSGFVPPSASPNGFVNGGYNTGRMPSPDGMSLFGNQNVPFNPSFSMFNYMRDPMGQPVMGQPVMGQPGMPQPAMAQSGMTQPAMAQSGMTQPAMPQSGMTQPAMPQPGMTQPAMPQPGMTQPAMPQPGMTQPTMPQPLIQPSMPQPSSQQSSTPSSSLSQPTNPQTNFSVEYMFSQPKPQPDQHGDNFLFMPPYQQAPMISSFIPPAQPPRSPHLTAAHPPQQPSLIGQHIAEPGAPRLENSKTTIVPLATPVREPPREPPHHQRGLSSVVRNAGLIEDEDEDEDEDEEDYEARIEKNERKTDEAVKYKVMTALQSALSDLQLTGIQIKWSEIEVDQRIGVGGFAIVYHGMYR